MQLSVITAQPQARNQGGSEWVDDLPPPHPSAKGPLSQVKESIRACNKIQIVSSRSLYKWI